MTTGSVFRSNRTQAVRLPKAVAFPNTVRRVQVETVGEARLLTPVVETWKEWAQARQAIDPEFLSSRDQGIAEERDWDDR